MALILIFIIALSIAAYFDKQIDKKQKEKKELKKEAADTAKELKQEADEEFKRLSSAIAVLPGEGRAASKITSFVEAFGDLEPSEKDMIFADATAGFKLCCERSANEGGKPSYRYYMKGGEYEYTLFIL